VQEDRAAEVAAELTVVGELLELLVERAVGAGCGVVFGEDERDSVGRPAARSRDLDLDLVHRARIVPKERGGIYFVLTNRA
jgi:hypothetical protein